MYHLDGSLLRWYSELAGADMCVCVHFTGCILLIIAIVLFVLSRIKPNHAIPTRMRTMAHTVHNKFAQPAMMESELYLSREDYVKVRISAHNSLAFFTQ